MSEYQIKLDSIEEYMHALHYRKMNEELCNSLLGLLGQLFNFYQKNGMPIPEEVTRVIDRTSEVLEAQIAPAVRA